MIIIVFVYMSLLLCMVGVAKEDRARAETGQQRDYQSKKKVRAFLDFTHVLYYAAA